MNPDDYRLETYNADIDIRADDAEYRAKLADKIAEIHRAIGKQQEAALDAAWKANRCPQCGSGVHPEALTIVNLSTVTEQPMAHCMTPPVVTARFLVACVRCVDTVVDCVRAGVLR